MNQAVMEQPPVLVQPVEAMSPVSTGAHDNMPYNPAAEASFDQITAGYNQPASGPVDPNRLESASNIFEVRDAIAALLLSVGTAVKDEKLVQDAGSFNAATASMIQDRMRRNAEDDDAKAKAAKAKV